MKLNKHKYQVEYENTDGLFWDNKPAKYVQLFVEIIQNNLENWTVLDLGAGEGKNAVYLAKLGGLVTAVDISPIALSKFSLQPDYEYGKRNIKTVNCNVVDIELEDSQFDLVIAYGLFHCLSSHKKIEDFVKKVKKWTKKGGYFIGATFTDKIPPPDSQDYLSLESFLPTGMLETFFSDWKIIYTEEDIITETHPTNNIPHQHSITRVIAQKI